MRAYWILPNRDQRDDILASDGETILPLRQILDPKIRPDGFSHGVPTEILEKCDPGKFAEILFAQRFPNWNGDKQIFSVSTPAGLDTSSRVVHLGLLVILEPHERPRFDLPPDTVPKEDRPYARTLIERLTSPKPGDTWAKSVQELSELPAPKRPVTNVALDRAVARFDSLYFLAPGGVIKKASSRKRSRRTVAISLCLLAIAGGWFYAHVRHCPSATIHGEAIPRSAIQTGVVKWPSN
jgi:hypothetical protein